MYSSVLHSLLEHTFCVCVCCSVLQCVQVYCSMLQCTRRVGRTWLYRSLNHRSLNLKEPCIRLGCSIHAQLCLIRTLILVPKCQYIKQFGFETATTNAFPWNFWIYFAMFSTRRLAHPTSAECCTVLQCVEVCYGVLQSLWIHTLHANP